MGDGPIDRLRNRQYPAIFLYLLLIAGAFLVGIIIFNLVIMPALVGSRNTETVPAIQGMSLKQAADVVHKERLEISVIGHRSSDEFPDGYILSQDPAQGRPLKPGREIKVVVSSGREMEIVPSFAGKTLREAEVLASSSGLSRGRTVRVFAPDRKQPAVIATSPAAGARVPRGEPVDLLVAMPGEPKAYLMPNLVGRDFPFVKELLEKRGFNVVRVVSRREEKRFPGTILAQTPAARTKIKEGDTIELVVSRVE